MTSDQFVQEHYDEVRKYLQRHFVALAVGPTGIENACSCFVMEVGAHWFLVTAGHIADELKTAKAQGISFRCQIFDAWKDGANKALLPFHFEPDEWVIVDDRELGIDIACTKLSEVMRRSLETNEIVALAPRVWRAPPHGWSEYVMIGLPSQFIYKKAKNQTNVAVVWIKGVKECEPTDALGRVKTKRFYGKLPPDSGQLNGAPLDISGMSGGPIFGLHGTDEGTTYALVAIQSGWDPTARVIAGSFAVQLGLFLEDLIRRDVLSRR